MRKVCVDITQDMKENPRIVLKYKIIIILGFKWVRSIHLDWLQGNLFQGSNAVWVFFQNAVCFGHHICVSINAFGQK